MDKLKYGFDYASLQWWLSTHEDVIFKKHGEGHVHPDYRTIFVPKAGSKILAIAHLDTVAALTGMSCSKKGRMVHATGLDDRLGAYIVMEWLSKHGVIADVLLTDGEESGCSTASCFGVADDYNWIVEFDRAGEDVVTYGLDSPEWLDALHSVGFKLSHGSYSDISSLITKRCCVNIGVGYQHAHSLDSYADLEVLDRQLSKFKKFYKQYKNTAFDIVKPIYNYVGRSAYDPWPPQHNRSDRYCSWCFTPIYETDLKIKGESVCRDCYREANLDEPVWCDGCGEVVDATTQTIGFGNLCHNCLACLETEDKGAK